MNPFEITRDPDGGIPTIRVKHGYVVLTEDEDKAIAAEVARIKAENAKLRELVRDTYKSAAFWIDHFGDWYSIHTRMAELGIEVDS